MTGQNTILDNLHFLCPCCRAELSVPPGLAGVEGPCPSCFGKIVAPVPGISGATPALLPIEALQFPPLRECDPEPILIPHLPRSAPGDPDFSLTTPERNFTARLAIPPQEEPLDESWKDRCRSQRRQTRRARKVEEVAHHLLNSRGFQIARVILIMLSGAMLVWLFQYLQNHHWRLPGMAPAIAEEKTGGSNDLKPPANTNELMTDDDTEIPPAASHTPSATGSTPGHPVAGRKDP